MHRAGFCAIIGRPNVGKSTLLNRILGQKLAIVTPKPQTTRTRILAVKNFAGSSEHPDSGQIVFLDTPGIHRARSPLNRAMVQQALGAAHEADVVLYVLEVPMLKATAMARDFELGAREQFIISELRSLHARGTPPAILVALNKIDRLSDRRALLPLLEKLAQAFGDTAPKAFVPIAAETGDGVEGLVESIRSALPEGPPLYPEEMLTDRAERWFAGEMIREQVFLHCKEEIPYSSAVEIEAYEDRERDVVISAVIAVERSSQKAILIGKSGSMIKTIGMNAREQIARFLDVPVHLELRVTVESDWTRHPDALRRLGYVP